VLESLITDERENMLKALVKAADFIGQMLFLIWIPGFFGIAMYVQYSECMNLVCADLVI
jgi:hypothetical protein